MSVPVSQTFYNIFDLDIMLRQYVFLCLLLVVFETDGSKTKILVFQHHGHGKDSIISDHYLKIFDFSAVTDSKKQQQLQDISLCLRYKVSVFTRQHLFFIGNYLGHQLRGKENGISYVRLQGLNYAYFEPEHRIQWYHFCLAFDSTKDDSLFMVLNGKLLYDDLVGLPGLNFTIGHLEGAGLTIGFDEDLVAHNHFEENLFHGQITEFYIWSQALSVDFMIKVTGDCIHAPSNLRSQDQPDIFNMDTYLWTGLETNSIKIKDSNGWLTENKCHEGDENAEMIDRFIPLKVEFELADVICQSLGGHIWFPKSEQDYVNVLTKAMSVKNNPMKNACSNDMWIGLTKINGSTIQAFDGQIPPPYVNFEPGQPNGRDAETCVSIYGKSNTDWLMI